MHLYSPPFKMYQQKHLQLTFSEPEGLSKFYCLALQMNVRAYFTWVTCARATNMHDAISEYHCQFICSRMDSTLCRPVC